MNQKTLLKFTAIMLLYISCMIDIHDYPEIQLRVEKIDFVLPFFINFYLQNIQSSFGGFKIFNHQSEASKYYNYQTHISYLVFEDF